MAYEWEDESLRNQALLSGAITGATTGATVGSAVPVVGTTVGGVAGAIAGLGVGYMSAKSQDEALQEEMARQEELQAELDAVDSMADIATAVGAVGAKQRTMSKVASETEAGRLGLTGAQKAEFTQGAASDIASQEMAALGAALPGAIQADVAMRESILGEEVVSQELIDATMDATGGEIEALGELGGTAAEVAALISENKADAATASEVDPTSFTWTAEAARAMGESGASTSRVVDLSDPAAAEAAFAMDDYRERRVVDLSDPAAAEAAFAMDDYSGVGNMTDTNGGWTTGSSEFTSGDFQLITDHDAQYDYKKTTRADGTDYWEFKSKGSEKWGPLNQAGIKSLTTAGL